MSYELDQAKAIAEYNTPTMMHPSLGEVWIEFRQRRFDSGYDFERMVLVVQEDFHRVLMLDLFTGTFTKGFMVSGFGTTWEKMV